MLRVAQPVGEWASSGRCGFAFDYLYPDAGSVVGTRLAVRERIMNHDSFFNALNYTSVNEDWRTERKALQIRHHDRILCVAGSGDRPLNLLVDAPASVVALDRNDAQLKLLRLKIAAMRTLPYEDYVGFLGLNDHRSRAETWTRVAHGLEESARAFWSEKLPALKKGILYQGRWERYYRRISRLVSSLRGRDIETLFELHDLETQRAFVQTRWDKKWWRTLFDIMCSPTFSRLFFRDPAFYRHVPRSLAVGAYLYQGLLDILRTYLARDNFMLALLFRGRLLASDLPPYLSRDSVDGIRERCDRISPLQSDLLEFLESCTPKSFTRFSLSDTPSFFDQRGFERLLDGVVRAATPGARICVRQFLTDHTIPERLRDTIHREPRLEEELRKSDRAFAYRFIVGEVQP